MKTEGSFHIFELEALEPRILLSGDDPFAELDAGTGHDASPIDSLEAAERVVVVDLMRADPLASTSEGGIFEGLGEGLGIGGTPTAVAPQETGGEPQEPNQDPMAGRPGQASPNMLSENTPDAPEAEAHVALTDGAEGNEGPSLAHTRRANEVRLRQSSALHRSFASSNASEARTNSPASEDAFASHPRTTHASASRYFFQDADRAKPVLRTGEMDRIVETQESCSSHSPSPITSSAKVSAQLVETLDAANGPPCEQRSRELNGVQPNAAVALPNAAHSNDLLANEAEQTESLSSAFAASSASSIVNSSTGLGSCDPQNRSSGDPRYDHASNASLIVNDQTSVTNSSLLAPGNSPGITDIVGDYTQTADATLQIEIGGLSPGPGTPVNNGYDQVNVSGLATLDGTLEVSLLDDFVPGVGDTFDFLTFGSVDGHFANATGLYGFGDDLYFDIVQIDPEGGQPGKLQLVAREVPSLRAD